MKRMLRFFMAASAVLAILALAACSGGSAGGSSDGGSGGDGSATDAEWPAMAELQSLDASDISSISFTRYTASGSQGGMTKDPGEIEDIYLRLLRVDIVGPTDMAITDNDLSITLNTVNGSLSFSFEGNILVLGRGVRYEVEHLGALKSYLSGLMEEESEGEPSAEPAGEPDEEPATATASTGATTEAEPDEGTTAPNAGAAGTATAGDGDKVFASEQMGFSFLYDGAHTAYITPAGAAEIAINGDETLEGLFVSVVDGNNMPSVDQILEEGMFNETQKYQNAIAQPPARNEITVDGHVLEGYIFAYSDLQGETVDATYYVEVRDGVYIFYRTEMYRHAEDYWAGQDALEKAIRTLQLSAGAYGPSDAVPGDIGTDNAPHYTD